MTPFIAELIGTALMILLGEGVVANVLLNKTKGNNGGIIAITTAWALAVFVGVLVAGPYSGAHLNPAVSLGLAIGGKFAWSMVAPYIVAQLIGAAVGATLVWMVYYDHFKATEDTDAKLAVFCTSPAIANRTTNFISELVGTFVLIFAVFYITGAQAEVPNGSAPVAIGLGSVGALPIAFVVWAIGLALGGTTGYAINPARDFAPRAMHAILPMGKKGSSMWGYALNPIVAPITGAAVAAGLFLCLQ